MMRILHVVSVMDVGGMESYIMNMYRHIDTGAMQFDFLVHHARRGVFEDEIEALGGHVYHTTLLDDWNVAKYLRTLKMLFSKHPEYRIVHGHLGSTAFLYLGMAKRCGVPWRILHSHCPGFMHTLKGYAKHLLFYLSPIHANVALACSTEAGKYQFKSRPFEVIPNGIDVKRFLYSEESRVQKRRELGLEGKFVVGHVGRFFLEKNHSYILKIFKAIKEQRSDAVLMLLGDGPLRRETQEMAKALRIEDDVLFMGIQKDSSPFYQAMDVFIMPSLYEGLPLAGIEAQCAALPCLFTDAASREIALNERSAFLPIGDEHIDRWVETVVQIGESDEARAAHIPNADGFDMESRARDMVHRYETMWESCV